MVLLSYNFTPTERTTFKNTLQNFALKKYPEILTNTQKEKNVFTAQQHDYLSRAETLNQEFSERYAITGPENPLPFLAVNQDLLLYMFTFTYLLLVLTSTVYVSRITDSTTKGLFVLPIGIIGYVLMMGLIIQFA